MIITNAVKNWECVSVMSKSDRIRLATTQEAQAISEILSNSKSLGNFSISYHPRFGYNEARAKHGNPYTEADGTKCISYIGIRVYKMEGGLGTSVYSEDLK